MKFNKQGFTRIETIMIVSLLAVLSFGIGNFIVTSVQNWLLISGRQSAVSAARAAVSRVVAELKRIKKPQNILTAATAECQFIDLNNQIVAFSQSGTNLLRNSDILTTNLASPEGLRFKYLDASGEATDVALDIRSIRVRVYLSSG